ncbi:MAG: N-acetylglucosamine kinase [Acidobacteriaceae bacterium]
MAYYLGIDAGATKTQCVLATETELLARVQGGSIKITRVGQAGALENLRHLLAAMVSESGISLASVTSTCVGLSGSTIASVADWVRNALSAQVGGELLLYGDEEIALDAAFQGKRGILVIAGTGSNVVARTFDGQMVRAGGWGPVLSDQGSGSRIGLLAARAIFHAIDNREPTALLPALHAAWKTHTIEELVDLGNRAPGPDFSQLAPMVAACAANGDIVADRVLRYAGVELADLVCMAMRHASSLEAGSGSRPAGAAPLPWTIAYTGSVVEKISLLRQSMIEAIHRDHPTAQLSTQPADAVLGALWLARQRAKGGCDY